MIERKLYNDGRLVLTRCSGVVTPDELIDSAHWMIDHYGREIKPGFRQLFDARRADTVLLTEEVVHRVAHINLNHGRHREGFSMAIVAVKPYPQALARLHKLLSKAAGIQVELFSDVAAACEWLGYHYPLPETDGAGGQ